MRKKVVVIVSIILLFWQFVLPWIAFPNFYNGVLDVYQCNNPWGCAHEQAHSIDRNLGFPSQSKEFKEAVESIRANGSMYGWIIEAFPGVNDNPMFQPDSFLQRLYLLGFGWGGYGELYADLYAYHVIYGVPIPNTLAPFYSN